MKQEEKQQAIADALAGQDLFKCLSVGRINHKPHPYMIGPRHVTYASKNHGGMLGEETCKNVPCAHPGCTHSYEQHTSTEVGFLQLLRNGTAEEASTILKAVVDKLGVAFLDGFTFVETKENYRIT